MKHSNPIVQEVIEKMETVTAMTKSFVQIGSAVRGLLIPGNAGIGKTHFVKRAFIETGTTESVDYVKGGSVTAPSIYYKLWLNRERGRVLVLDDVDLIHKSKSEVSAILDLFKGATELEKGEKVLTWLRASQNQLFKENEVPMEFDFQGSIIWITNENQESLVKSCGPHWQAISSRFRQVPVWLNDQEKLLYTLYLIEEVGLLGKECQAKEGGYPEPVIAQTAKYLRENWKNMDDVTPRVAINIADTMDLYPDSWEVILRNSLQ